MARLNLWPTRESCWKYNAFVIITKSAPISRLWFDKYPISYLRQRTLSLFFAHYVPKRTPFCLSYYWGLQISQCEIKLELPICVKVDRFSQRHVSGLPLASRCMQATDVAHARQDTYSKLFLAWQGKRKFLNKLTGSWHFPDDKRGLSPIPVAFLWHQLSAGLL